MAVAQSDDEHFSQPPLCFFPHRRGRCQSPSLSADSREDKKGYEIRSFFLNYSPMV